MLESLGHYKILDRIGGTSAGEVYRARDTKLGRTVAIKVLPPELARHTARRQQFLADARAALVLSHPTIAALFEVGEENDLAYLVCEYVPGEPLTTMIASRSLSPRRAIDYATQLADAVADAHAEGIAHRHLRTTTITVTPKEKVKILDFGFAGWMNRPGAPPPASPEDADFRADVVAVVAILYEMLLGKQPPPNPAPPSWTNPNVPKEIDPMIAKALGTTSGRYESAATLAAELRSVVAILDVRSGDKEPPTLLPPHPRRRRVPPVIVVVLVLAALTAIVWLASRAA
ncbi:MAG: hypothetical protein A3H97_23565 [Acidobacteria bacterium RIFCSPLOWO2_02_FULL_65_29]|nr:MAG: hypothetical protein A3H97_23565 [Acidobacteria bacterium RIFCSPLOWO2_02_FULL_65_29]